MSYDRIIERAVNAVAAIVILAMIGLLLLMSVPYVAMALLLVIGIGLTALALFVVCLAGVALWELGHSLYNRIKDFFKNA